MPVTCFPNTDYRVLLCVCGGIAAYKSAELVRRLRDAGAQVQVAMTDAAQRFVGTQTFQALSHQPVRTSLWDAQAEAAMGHLELARWAQQVVIAPATANTLAKLAQGVADDLVTTLCLATEAPAPATTKATVVEILKVPLRSPPVPQVSSKSDWLHSTFTV